MANLRGGSLGAPFPLGTTGSGPTYTSLAIDQAGDRAEWIFQVPSDEAVTIHELGFRYTGTTGTPVQHKISLQGVGATGNPDGTIKGGGSPASGTFTPPANATWDGTAQWVTLANDYAAARGEWLAIVIEPVGTPDASNNGSFSLRCDVLHSYGAPYSISNNNGSRTRHGNFALFGYRSSSKTYGRLFSTVNRVAYASDSTPDEYAMCFTPSAGYGDTYKVAGIRAILDVPTAGKTVKVILYSGTTILAQTTFDTDVESSGNFRTFNLYFDKDAAGSALSALPALTFGSTYRIGFAPQETGNSFSLACLQLPAAGDLSAFAEGSDFYLSTRTDAGAWSDDTTQRPLVELILGDWTEPTAGGGGLLINPGLSGGVR